MGLCNFHGYFKGDGECQACINFILWSESVKQKKIEAADKRFQQKINYVKKVTRQKASKSGKDNRLFNYRKRADDAFSMYVRGLYNTPSGYTHCRTCGAIKETFGGLFNGIHAGHYFPKGKFWWLRYRVENALPQCYDCNVNNKEIIPAMRPKLVALFGEESIKKFEQDSELRPTKTDREAEILWYKSELGRIKELIKKMDN